MIAFKTHFDGERIVTPPEMRGATPREEVVVVVQELPPAEAAEPDAAQRSSIPDFAGKALVLRTAEDIDRQVREERESWGDR